MKNAVDGNQVFKFPSGGYDGLETVCVALNPCRHAFSLSVMRNTWDMFLFSLRKKTKWR